MEQPASLANTMPEDRDILEAQIRECFGRVVYSHKTHEKCADILLDRLSRIKLGQIVLSAVITGGLFATVFGSASWVTWLTAIISTALLGLNAYTKDYDLGELAQKHRRAASDLWLIREQYLSLLTDLALRGSSIEQIKEQRDSLLERLHAIYSGAPSTNFQAYRKAQEALKRYEDMTFSIEEIDAFLPNELKKSKK